MHLRIFATLASVALLAAACGDDDGGGKESPPAMNDAALARTALLQASAGAHAFSAAREAVLAEALQRPSLSGGAPDTRAPTPRDCGNVSLAGTGGAGFPAILTLDFAAGCRDANGQTFSGAIVASFSGPLGVRGTRVTLGLEDFAVDGVELSGAFSFEELGSDDRGNRRSRHDLVAGQYAAADGDGGAPIVLDETTFSEQIAGAATTYATDGLAGLRDDVFADNRVTTLTLATGETFSITTGSDIARPVDCDVPTRGRLQLTSPTLAEDGALDYGDGTCDRRATITYAGEVVDVNF